MAEFRENLNALPEIPGYSVRDALGGSPSSKVYLADQHEPKRLVALKLIDLKSFDNPSIANALMREGDTVATLSHDNIVTVYGCGVSGYFYFLAMEHLTGGDLQGRIRDGMHWRDAVSVGRSLADALAHAHIHGIIHRDVKPANVIFHQNGKPVLCDFGIAKIVHRESIFTRMGVTAGTPYYMAPEMFAGKGATPQSDLYALGVMMFEMLAGHKPFDGDNIQTVKRAHINDELPPLPGDQPEVEALIARLMAKEAEQRPAEAQSVADELQAILESQGGATVARAATPTQADATQVDATVPEGDHATVAAGEATNLTREPGTTILGVGSRVRDRFKIEAVLGEGGMGTVYYARDLLKEEAGDEDPYVALKVLHPQIASAEISFMALQREARRAQDLAHPNIVTVFDLDRVDGAVYMSMEMLRGKDSEQLVTMGEGEGGLEPERARGIVNDIAAGLAYAHERGITHADLKPQNVFITQEGRAKLLDFGIARAHRANKPDVIEEIFSGYTPAYASPEILAGDKAMPSDDIYALGCMAYFYFTGAHPFKKMPASEAKERGLKANRPKGMKRAEWNAVSAALSFEGSRRPQDAGQFARKFAPPKALKIAAGVSTSAIAVAIAVGLYLGSRTGPEIPFEELAPELQATINRSLEEAAVFFEAGAVNATLQLYDQVLKAHAGNSRATEGMNETVDYVLETTEAQFDAGTVNADDARVVYATLLQYETLPEGARDRVIAAQQEL